MGMGDWERIRLCNLGLLGVFLHFLGNKASSIGISGFGAVEHFSVQAMHG
jgi:hypothetical protein